jgi:hypothetical protein
MEDIHERWLKEISAACPGYNKYVGINHMIDFDLCGTPKRSFIQQCEDTALFQMNYPDEMVSGFIQPGYFIKQANGTALLSACFPWHA